MRKLSNGNTTIWLLVGIVVIILAGIMFSVLVTQQKTSSRSSASGNFEANDSQNDANDVPLENAPPPLNTKTIPPPVPEIMVHAAE